MAKRKQPEDREARPENEPTGEPGSGSGVGRREDVRGSGVYPASGAEVPDDAEVRTPGEWGKRAGGEEGGASELHFTEEELRAIERGEIPAPEQGEEQRPREG
jgi:hypothetical protein